MPSHPDRVRRNYHDIQIREYQSYYMETNIHITISRLALASAMSRREIEREIWRKVQRGLKENRLLHD